MSRITGLQEPPYPLVPKMILLGRCGNKQLELVSMEAEIKGVFKVVVVSVNLENSLFE